MWKRVLFLALILAIMPVAFALARARDQVWIRDGDGCGFLGHDQNLENDSDSPMIVTIRVFPYGSMQVLRTFTVRVEGGEAKYLGCNHPEQSTSTWRVYQVYRARYAS